MSFSEAYSWINIQFLLEGLLITVEVAFYSIIFSVILGFILGIIRYFDIPVISKITSWVVDIIRYLPLLHIIFLSLIDLSELRLSFAVFRSAVSRMTIFEALIMCEIVRVGLKALPKRQ